MLLSKQVIATLSDLIENRLAIMTVHDQDDLREKLNLQHALTELRGENGVPAGVLNDFSEIPRRGRRRKVGGMVEA
jgi:hypothetical protein